MAESWIRTSNAKVTIIGLCLQMLVVGVYVNIKLNTWIATGIPINSTHQMILPIVRNELLRNFSANSSSIATSSTTTGTTTSSTTSTTTTSTIVEYSIINRDRVNWMREYCADYKQKIVKNYPSYEKLRSGLPSYVWMASPLHNLFYCATPKCASTTWKTYLLEDLQIKWSGDNHVAATKIGLKKQFTERKTDFMQFLEKYRPTNRLAIVRNPWARLVSAYEDKIVRSKWSLGKLCVSGNKYHLNKTIPSFYTLMDCLTTSSREVIWNPHINPFTSLCGFCHMDYNMIVKMEELAEAEPFIKTKLNFTKVDLHYKPPRKGKYSNTYAIYYKNLTDSHVKQLQEIYRNDIELFNYPRSPFE